MLIVKGVRKMPRRSSRTGSGSKRGKKGQGMKKEQMGKERMERADKNEGFL